jgi:hypothetical protein
MFQDKERLALCFIRKLRVSQTWWLPLVILATWEVEIERLWFEASLGKKIARSYLKNQDGDTQL